MFPEGRILDFLIVGVIALIVVGPKDLPVLMRKVGKFIAHMRGLAAEFRASFDEMARQSELDELRREVEALKNGQNLATATGLGPGAGVGAVFDDIHASLREGQVQLHPMMSHQYPSSLEAPPEPGPHETLDSLPAAAPVFHGAPELVTPIAAEHPETALVSAGGPAVAPTVRVEPPPPSAPVES
jgi:sec-independent protein translocase protein TatB